MACSHHYAIPHDGKIFCLSCKQYVELVDEEPQELVMPPRIFEIKEKLWTTITPWPNIGIELAKEYNWYLSVLNSQDYLVMPIVRDGKTVFYSARLIGERQHGLKYQYPKGVKKSYWISTDKLEQDPIIFCEGVADAVYCSSISSSVAVLGSYYDGSLDNLVRGRDVAICFDGDSAGILGSLKIMRQLHTAKSTRLIMLPEGKDPTDIPITELTKLIKGEL